MTPLFYISFCVLSTFVMLNLVVATLMGELERAGAESTAEEPPQNKDASHAQQLNVYPLDKQESLVMDSGKGSNQTAEEVVVTTKGAEENIGAGTTDHAVAVSSVDDTSGLPVQTSPELSQGSTAAEEGMSSSSRVKLDPLPMRPVSPPPSVFVPFAPETIAENEPEEVPPAAPSTAESL